MFFVDTDILSAFVKVGGIKYLRALFQNLNIAPSIYEELARAKRAGYPYLDNYPPSSQRPLPAPSPLRTGLATLTTSGSSLS